MPGVTKTSHLRSMVTAFPVSGSVDWLCAHAFSVTLHVACALFRGLIRSLPLLARGDEGPIELRPVVLRSRGLIGAMTLLGLPKKLDEGRHVQGAEPTPWQPRLDLLDQPAVPVRIAERSEREVGPPLRIRTGHLDTSARGEVEDFAHLGA